jgi:hypothetical protein
MQNGSPTGSGYVRRGRAGFSPTQGRHLNLLFRSYALCPNALTAVVGGVMGRRLGANRASEADIAFAVLVIAAFQPNGVATFRRLRREIPIHARLSELDTTPSIIRPNEELWIQRMRNIRIHRDVPGNFIHDGYLIHIPHVGFKITPAGLRRRMRGRRGVS